MKLVQTLASCGLVSMLAAIAGPLACTVTTTSYPVGDGGLTNRDGSTRVDGATAGDGGGVTQGSKCAGLCERAGRANCTAHDPASCASDCASTAGQLPSACASAFEAVLDCSATQGTFTCDNEGQPRVSNCKTESNALIACVQANLATDGGPGGDGGACNSNLTTNDAECDRCLSTSCCPQSEACSKNSSCVSLINCIGAAQCQDQACIDRCEAQHPGGVTDARAFNGCVSRSCRAACQ